MRADSIFNIVSGKVSVVRLGFQTTAASAWNDGKNITPCRLSGLCTTNIRKKVRLETGREAGPGHPEAGIFCLNLSHSYSNHAN